MAFFVLIVASFAGLMFALKTLPVGPAYAVWVGIGAVLTAVVGMVAFDDPVNAVTVGSIALIVAGVVGLQVAGTVHKKFSVFFSLSDHARDRKQGFNPTPRHLLAVKPEATLLGYPDLPSTPERTTRLDLQRTIVNLQLAAGKDSQGRASLDHQTRVLNQPKAATVRGSFERAEPVLYSSAHWLAESTRPELATRLVASAATPCTAAE